VTTTFKKRQMLELFKAARVRIIAAREAYYSGESQGVCPHGVYVGGCGIDWMCGYCEDGPYEITQEAIWAAKTDFEYKRRAARHALAEQLTDLAVENREWLTFDDHTKVFSVIRNLYAE
jgi:hypothetical protein